MQLLKFLVISSAAAAWSQSQALCSAAVKSLDVPSFPPAAGEEVKKIEYTKEESTALFEHECAKDPTCSKGGDLNTFPNITELKERMSRNESSFEVFKWGYRIYVPNAAQMKANGAHTKACEEGIFGGITSWCYKNFWAPENQNPFVIGGTLTFCALFVLPPVVLCRNIGESIGSLNLEGGAVLSATWSTAWSPTIKAASDYFLQ